MNNMIKIYNENNELEEVEVINFYQLEEYNHEYILYTKNEEEGEDIVTYISIIKQVSDDEYQFEAITDPEEEKMVEEMIYNDIDRETI